MDSTEIPLGFGMALVQNGRALKAYSVMTETQKQAVLTKAKSTRSEKEMWQIVSGIAENNGVK